MVACRAFSSAVPQRGGRPNSAAVPERGVGGRGNARKLKAPAVSQGGADDQMGGYRWGGRGGGGAAPGAQPYLGTCLYVCICTLACICVCACMPACLCACVPVCLSASLPVCLPECLVDGWMHACMRACLCVVCVVRVCMSKLMLCAFQLELPDSIIQSRWGLLLTNRPGLIFERC